MTQLVKNELIKLISYRPFKYLVLSMVITLSISAFVTLDQKTIQFFLKFEISKNSITAFFLGQYLLFCLTGLIITNLVPVFLMRIESNSDSWKYLFSMPTSPQLMLYSKLATCFLTNFLLVIVVFILTAFEGLFLLAKQQGQPFYEYIDSIIIFLFLLIKFLLISFSATAIHYIITLILKGEAIRIILSFILPIICHFEFLMFLPYGWPFRNFWRGVVKDINWKNLIGSYEFASILIVLFIITTIFYSKNKIVRKLIISK